MCKRCEERGKTWNGSDPVCGFTDDGKFNPQNWNCATLGGLRRIMVENEGNDGKEEIFHFRDDTQNASIGVLPVPDIDEATGWLVMTWYKSRGRTGRAIIIEDDDVLHHLRLEEAEAILDWYEKNKQ